MRALDRVVQPDWPSFWKVERFNTTSEKARRERPSHVGPGADIDENAWASGTGSVVQRACTPLLHPEMQARGPPPRGANVVHVRHVRCTLESNFRDSHPIALYSSQPFCASFVSTFPRTLILLIY